MNVRTTLLAPALMLSLALSFAGCAASTPAPSATSGSSAENSAPAEAVTVKDAWVKAAEKDMTGSFGVLHNNTDAPITVTGVSSTAASHVEMHETVDSGDGNMKMQQKDGGFQIPSGGDFELKPGANHIMFMGLTAPIVAGESITLTLELSDGSSVTYDAPAKDYSGANESYEG